MTFSRLFLVFLAAFSVAGPARAAPQGPVSNPCTTSRENMSGETALSAGDAARARRGPVEAACWYQKAADRGNAVAQRKLGLLYLNGEGVIQDFKAAAKLFGMAAAQGDIEAIDDLAALYQTGQGVPKNHPEAMRLWRIAAARGDDWAKQSMAKSELEEAALGVPNLANADPCRARPGDFKVETEIFSAEKALNAGQDRIGACWMRLAAEAGHHSGQEGMGGLYYHGKGVPQNYKIAQYWLTKSAQQGNAAALFDLGLMAENGQGMPASHELATTLWILAAQRGDESARTRLVRDGFAKSLGLSSTSSNDELKEALAKTMLRAALNGSGSSSSSVPGRPMTYEEQQQIEAREMAQARADHDRWWQTQAASEQRRIEGKIEAAGGSIER